MEADFKTNLEGPARIVSDRKDYYPLKLDYIFPNIGEENCEDVIWQNVIDDTSEIPQYEIGVSLTQSYHYTKLEEEPTVLVRWQAIRTRKGPEFRIGLGHDTPGDKNTPPILKGNYIDGIETQTPITIQSCLTIGSINGELALKKVGEDKWYKIQLGEEIVQNT